MPEELLLSLPECHQRLTVLMGETAPAIVTLKKWSSRGKLKTAKVQEGRSRPRYRFSVVRKLAEQSVAKQQALKLQQDQARAASKRPAVPRPARKAAVDLAPLLDSLRTELGTAAAAIQTAVRQELAEKALSSALQDAVSRELTKVSGEVLSAIHVIDSIKRHLMNKYDAEVTALKERVRELERENATLREQSRSLDAQRVNANLTRILEKIDTLQQQLA